MKTCPACGMSNADVGICAHCSKSLLDVKDEASTAPSLPTHYGPSALLRRLGLKGIEPDLSKKRK